jgi:hypothetical protein
MRTNLRKLQLLCLSGLVLASLPSAGVARPAHKKALAEYLGPFMTPRLNDCRTCHLAEKKDGEGEDEKPHNAFGTRLKAERIRLRKAGMPAGVADALNAVAGEDSDRDGVSNLIELLAGNNPGETADVPSPARVVETRKTLVEFRRRDSAYAWKPFEKVVRPPVPVVKNTDWVRNSIDAFVAKEQEQRGLKPRPEATREILLRRVYLDLIGLPPTPAELRTFLADETPDAYEKLVDRLLDDPRYGERWGRHWMDVWRYSDWAGWTGGGQIRDSQPHIWHWRDWIIEALNDDKPYDRMVLEMLAADELAPTDQKALRATGFLVRNYKMLSREKWLEDTVEHTSMAFLGVTIQCARCHDHMYDPLTQREYYQMRAIFEPHQVRTDRVPGVTDVKKDGLPRAYDANLTVPTYLFIRGDDRTPDKSKVIPPGVPESLGGKTFKVQPVKLPPEATTPDRRAFVVADLVRASELAVNKARAARDAARAKAGHPLKLAEADLSIAEQSHAVLLLVLEAERIEDSGKKNSPEWKSAATKAGTAQRELAVRQARCNLIAAQPTGKQKLAVAEQALKKAEANLKAPPAPAYTPRPVPHYPETSSGRRLAFARWIADRDNPLTARVAVNQLWMRHFGQPLVPRVFDFGRNGRPPSHPALLDWLAAEFVNQRWSMKKMHRLMMTSSAYRQASTPDAANLKLDPDNTYYWRMTPRRLEAELVRDCILYVSGSLDLTRGGPDIDYNLGMTVPRRSLYFRHAAEKEMEFLKLFDAASVTECYQRKESILPQQALALSNSGLTRRHGRLLARKLIATTKGDAKRFTDEAFAHVLSRQPTDQERAECVAFLKQQEHYYATLKVRPSADSAGNQPSPDPKTRAGESLVHVLLNHHDFVTVR